MTCVFVRSKPINVAWRSVLIRYARGGNPDKMSVWSSYFLIWRQEAQLSVKCDFMFCNIKFSCKRNRKRLRNRLRRFNIAGSLKECEYVTVSINFVCEESQQWLFERHFLGG